MTISGLRVTFTNSIMALIAMIVLGSAKLSEGSILDFLEELRVRMCHPIPKFGLPALDPYEIQHVESEINNKYLVDFTGSLTDFNVTGLSDFVVNEIKISTSPLKTSTVDISLPLTALNTLYTAKGSLAYIINMAGDGTGYSHVKDLRVAVSWSIKTGIHLAINKLKITIKIGEIFVDFENLMEEERINDFLHALINELGLELLDDLWQDEQEFIQKSIEKKLNAFLGQYTLLDVIKIIGSISDGPVFGDDDPPGDCKDPTKGILIETEN